MKFGPQKQHKLPWHFQPKFQCFSSYSRYHLLLRVSAEDFLLLLLISIYLLLLGFVTESRSGYLEVFCGEGVLSNFAEFTGKHLSQSLFFDKVAGHRPVTLLKKRLWHRCLPLNFTKFLRTLFLAEHLRWLLL